MDKAAKQKKNLEHKKAKMKVKKDIDIFRQEYDHEEVDTLNDDEFYALETDDGEPLFGGQALPGSLIKSMMHEIEKQPKEDD